MAITRRKLILGIGGGVALVAAGGLWRVTRMPEAAVRPWELAPPATADVRLDALRHAILAPNPHNRQPWLLQLDGNDRVTLYCDLAKRLPMTDPYDRQTVIGFGTFIELARIAASARGQRIDVIAFPDGAPEVPARLDARAVAHLHFAADPSVVRDPLVDVIPRRRSTKEAFNLQTPVEPAALTALSAPLPGVLRTASADPALVSELRDMMVKAFAVETRTPRTYQESIDLIRIGAAEINANPDGIDLSGPLFEGAAMTGMVTRAKLADPGDMMYTSGLDQQLEVYGSVPALLWLTTPSNTRRDQLAAGMAYVRTNLETTAGGLALHPQSQLLQEYPEMAALFAATQARLGAGGTARVQMLARLGHGPVVGPSPRWPLDHHLLAAAAAS